MNVTCETDLERFLVFDPATLYEAAGLQGMVDPCIRSAWPGAHICGFASTVECPPGDNLMLHHAVAAARPGEVLVARTGGYLLTGAWGEVLTAAAQARGVAGLAIDGSVRDIEAIARRGFPVFSRGLAIGAATKQRPGRLHLPMQFGGVPVKPGDLVFGDTDGLVIVPQERIEEVYAAALKRQQREAELMAQLRMGKTTIELLGLPALQEKK
jgi:4-hydroxy-4-methyl-2-oxoglutarate aldolase